MSNPYKSEFPIFQNRLENDKPLVYLDNAATTQKPETVIKAMEDYLRKSVANPYRGAYALSADATQLCEDARAKAAKFIHADFDKEIIFTKNTTDSMNLLALSMGDGWISSGDEILISVSEHHSNLLPWQRLAKKKGAVLRYAYLDDDGRISLDEINAKINEKTKIVAVAQISNVLGVKNPIAKIAEIAHQKGAIVVVDGAQSVPHIPVNVKELDVDFLAFSGHKMLGPGGIGVLYGKLKHLEALDPVMLGGGIVEEVTEQSVSFLDLPNRLEPGTPNVEGIVGLSRAIDYLQKVGLKNIQRIEEELTEYALKGMAAIPGITVYGEKEGKNRCGILAFNVQDVHPHDVASILDNEGVTIRAGHHCAQPLMQYLQISSCCRASLYLYNTKEDIDILLKALRETRRIMGYES